MTESALGSFVRHDYRTTDVERARAFYSELFGWRIDEVTVAGRIYHRIHVGDDAIGELASLGAREGPSHWIAYIATPSVDECTMRVARAGGRTCVPPTDIPAGRVAVSSDPCGAVFSPFTPSAAPPGRGDLTPGMVCWDELWTEDPLAAQRFYAEVFGWSPEPIEMLNGATYLVQKQGDRQIGGIMASPDPEEPTCWLPYFLTLAVDDDTDRATRLGAEVLIPCMDIPDIGRFAILTDPLRADFALFQPAPAPAGGAPEC